MPRSQWVTKFVLLVFAVVAPIAARGATTDVRVLFDEDNNIATGCLVAGLQGVDQVLVTRVETTATTATITSTTRQECVNGSLGVPTAYGNGWNAGFDPDSGKLLVETRIPFTAFDGSMRKMRIGIDAHQGALSHTALTTGASEIVYFPAPARMRRRATTAPGELRVFHLDGEVDVDWKGLKPKFVNVGGGGTTGLRIINLYAFSSTVETDEHLYFLFELNISTDAPYANDDAYVRTVGSDLVVPGASGKPTVLDNDVNPAGGPLTATLVTPPPGGNVTLDQTGGFHYIPNDASSMDPDSFEYKANNGKDSNVAKVTIGVSDTPTDEPNHAPSFTKGPDVSVLEDSSTQFFSNWATNISANDPGQLLAFEITGNSNPALFEHEPAVSPSGQLTFTPAPDAFGSATISIKLVDDGGTADGGVDESPVQVFDINVEAVNDEPTFSPGNDVTVDEDSGTYSAPWATAIDAGPNEGSQTVSFLVANDNNALFEHQPAINSAGTLTFTPATDAHGVATVQVTVVDNGASGAPDDNTGATVSFEITVNSINDAPTFVAGPNQSVNEDAAAQLVDPWATGITPGPADESGQTVTFNITGNSNPSLFSSGPTISNTGALSYTPAPDANGSATITVTLSDNGTPSATSGSQNFTITINSVNDEPSFTSGGDVQTDSDSGIRTFPNWATAIDLGATNEAAQTVSFEFTGNTNPGLFSVAPTIDATGTLTFTPVAGTTGSSTMTVQMRDSGGTANGGDDLSASAVFTITVDSAPAVTTTTPANGATGVVTNSNVQINFDENVDVAGTWFSISCATSGTHDPGNTNVAGGPMNFTIDPNADFVQGESCTATVFAAQVTDQDAVDAPNAMLANYVFTFTIDAQPIVVTTTPANGQTGVTTNANVIVAFSEAVNVTGTWFEINCATSGMHNPGNSAVSGGPTTFTIDPTDFTQGETCNATVFAAQVSDQDANDPLDNPAANYNFSFTIDAQPIVTSTTPANGDFSQQPTTDVTIVFSEAVNVTGNWFSLNCATSGTRDTSNTVVTTSDNITFTINPNVDFAVGETCTSVVLAANVSDQDANDPLDNPASDYNFTFGFDAPPSVSATTPTNGATNLPTNTDITIDFSEAVTLTSAWFSMTCGSTTITDADVAVTGGPTSYTLNPTADLPEGVTCNATVFATLVTDNDANDPPDTMTANHTFSFTTDAPPSVSSTTPANGATNQNSNTDVVINFSEAVNVTGTWISINCTVSGIHDTANGATTGSGSASVTLNPNSDFTQGETCNATVFAAQVADVDANDPPDLLGANYAFSFTIDAAPNVTTVTPANGATQIATNTNLSVTFSEPVTITNSSVTISCGTSGAHTVAVSGGPTTWTVNPDSDFATGELCTITVLAAQVSDNDSNDPPDNMLANHVWSFTTDDPPAVTATTPTNASTTFPSTDISITFSEPVDVTGSWFTISCTTTGAHTATVSGGPTVFSLNPDVDFAGGETCTVTILAAQVNDQDAGDPPSNPTADYVFSFGVDAAPTVTTTTPANGAVNQITSTNITVNFSEPVNVTGTTFTIACSISGTHLYTTGSNPSTSFTLDPNVDFTPGETCTVTVTGLQVSDDDAFDPPNFMAADYVFSFTMDAAPAVQTTTPANGATNIPSGADIDITFTEPVSASGASFTISCGVSGAHTFAVSGGPATWTLNPDTNFSSGETCTVTALAAGVTDVDANDPPDNMLANYVFSFTIDLAPTVTATTPANGAVDVAAGANIDLTFSEAVNLGSTPATISCTVSGAHTYVVSPLTAGTSFTLNPDTNFAEAETCTVTVLAAQVTDDDANDPPDNMAADYVFSFSIDLAPFVTATTPADNATNGLPAQDLTITFSEPVDVTGSWFTISCSTTGSHTAVVSGGPTTYTLNPDVDFAGGETCTVTIVAAQVTDQDANDPPDSMTADYVFDFVVDEPPTVLTTSPTNGTVDSATNVNIVITYSEPVTAGGTAYTITCPSNRPFVLSGNGTAVHTLDPNTNLPSGQTCTVSILAAQITDVDANDPPDNMEADYSFSFSTDANPQILSVVPPDASTGNPANTDITINWTESVSVTAVGINCTVSGAHTNVITGSPGATTTVNPDVDFTPGETCTITVLSANVTDTDTNDPPDNPGPDVSWQITIDQQPSVTATTPTNGAVNQAIDTNIVLTFSETVNAPDSAFTIECPSGSPQAFTGSGTGTNTITLDPTADLPTGVTCTVTVLAASVTDVDANDPPDGMAANYVFSFTTDQIPSVVSTVPIDETIDIARTSNITINFSENVDTTGATFTIKCPSTGSALPFAFVGASTGVSSVVLDPTANLPDGERCEVTVIGAQVSDTDVADPPNNMAGDFVFQFGVEPNADDETHPQTHVGNISSNSDGVLSVTSNDDYPVSTPVTITAYDATTANGGTIVMQTSGADMGEFTYNPPPGFEGTDTFTYTITNTNGTDTATVSIPVSGMVWFVNSTGPAGDGRLSAPFNTLAAFEAVNGNADVGNNRNPQAGDNIFLFENGTVYTGPVTLENNQRLIGQDSTVSLATATGLSPAGSQSAFPGVNSGNGVFVAISSAANGVNLGQNNTVRGMRFGNNTGFAISGGNAGTLALTDALINNTIGGGLNLANGTVSVVLASTSTTGGTHGVSLNGVAGTLSLGSGTITNATTAAIGITGQNPTVTHSGTISQTNGRPGLLTSNMTGGSISLGTVNVSGSVAAQDAVTLDGAAAIPAIDLTITSVTINTNNMRDGVRLSDLGSGSDVLFSGGTITTNGAGRRLINFTGATNCNCNFTAITLNGNSSDGLSLGATQLGTYAFGDLDMNTPNGGIGVQVVGDDNAANTDSAVTFRSVDINTCSNTGLYVHSHSGSFAINGTGAAGSGGTISSCNNRGARFGESATANDGAKNITLTDMVFDNNGIGNVTAAGGSDGLNGTNTNFGAGIDLHNADTLNFTRLDIRNGDQFGINGRNVTALTLNDVEVNNNGNEVFEDGIQIHNLFGTMTWTSVNVHDNAARQVEIQNASGTNNLTVTGTSNFTNAVFQSAIVGSNGFLFSGHGTANITVAINGANFARNYGSAFFSDIAGAASANVTVNGGTMEDNGLMLEGGGIGTGNFTYTLTGLTSAYSNPANTNSSPIGILKGSGASGTYTGTISNNQIGNASIASSSGPCAGCTTMLITNGGTSGTHNVTISGNTFRRSGDGVINVTSGINTFADSGQMNVKILNNTITDPDASSDLPITVVNGTDAGDTSRTCADILNNIISDPAGNGTWNAAAFIRLRHVQNNQVFRLPGYTGGSTDDTAVNNYLNGRNTLNNGGVSAVTRGAGPGTWGNTSPAGSQCF